jgi:hypothetical protein
MHFDPGIKRGVPFRVMRTVVAAGAVTVGSFAFQLGLQAGWFNGVTWIAPWAWGASAALWLWWIITHPKVEKDWLQALHIRLGARVHPIRAVLCLAMLICVSLGIRALVKRQGGPTSSPAAASSSLQALNQNEHAPVVESHPEHERENKAQPQSVAKPHPQPPKQQAALPASPGSISQNNSGGINVQQATTGSNSPIVNSPINIQASIDTGRRLKKEDREILIANLTGLKVDVAFGSILAVPDAYLYASDLRDAFNAAGLGAKGDMIQPMMFGSGSWTGIEVTWHGEAKTGPVDVLNSSDQGRILAALSAAHLGPISIHVGPEQPEGIIKIVVGLKPPS